MPTLFTMLMRNALYLEGARRGVAIDFGKIVRGLDAEVLRTFGRLPVDNLGNLSKADLSKFMRTLRTRLFDVFGKEDKRFQSTMRTLADIETEIFKKVFRENLGERIASPNLKKQFATVRNRDIAATGTDMAKAARTFRNSAVAEIEKVIRRGYIDKQAVQEILSAIRGLKSLGYRNGVLSKISAWADSYSNTVTQHVGSVVKHDMAERYYSEYDWISVLDESTTDICTERAGNRYRFGEGPIPPAHYGCRSEIVPVDPDDTTKPQRFADWLRDQPGEFLSDVFKGGRTDLDNVKVITLDAFKDKLEFILVG